MLFETIKNIDGYIYAFKPDTISAINVQPGARGANTTHVYGILSVSLEVAGAPQAIIEKYKLKKFVKFPGVLGEVWVRADAVSVCSTANATDHSDPPQSQSMLYVSGGPLKVNVEIETVKSMLETADGGGDTAASLTAMLSDGPSTDKPQRRVAPPSKTKPSRQ